MRTKMVAIRGLDPGQEDNESVEIDWRGLERGGCEWMQ
jgi:hypothetical protein